ncbi:ribonuclease T2 family protein [Colletotrichum higginsianum]|uniref:ribonuclease T2 n=2 Tax=Colletotrichum higginsianum TaxID=80884 RepID=H1VMP1_COLHI|nr:Ribonuclease T2 family protein [Colletotrichum higginsianum IMI 349063]OBR09076.1 Ribonuclease T2 family protein [Colletotrichum higginsianum IMI 349063]TIC95964.1 Ribonuclease Trv [Colletotrichum higginsianum]GJC96865.1 ribonuclease T2 family protein [Colletotrichum higginsianum]CCF41495.1 ribonuclease T2 family protein [Colletotrichum higginsianum]
MSRTIGFLAAAGLLRTAAAGLYAGLSTANHTCTLAEPVLSCSCGASPDKVDTCCVETYGGLVLATQFWNTHTGLESEGQKLPQDSWGIHGLWPDFCNGSYTQYCDLSRQYDPIPSPNTTTGKPDGTPVPAWTGSSFDAFVKPFERFDLLEYMNKFWIAQYTPNWVLWAHEFSKHATCFSTFDVECYGPKYQEHEEIVDFLETTVHYYKETPTWKWLADKAITPSNATAYSLADFQTALKEGHGAVPYIGCSGPRYNATEAGKGSLDNGYTQLSEAWYYFHVYGKPQRGDSVPVAADINGGRVSNCATTEGAVWYYERAEGSVQ